MFNAKFALVVLLSSFYSLILAQPVHFESTGIGGGGGLFSPSINPEDPSEFFVGCDLGALFHTKNEGKRYENVSGSVIDIFGKVVFTSDPATRYLLRWDEESYATRPSISHDGGKQWSFLSGDSQPWESKYFLYADYQHPQRVVWTTYDEIWISQDGGQSDKKLYTAKTGGGVLLSGVYFMGDTIYFGTNDGVLVSYDGGNTLQNAGFKGIPDDERIMGFGGGTKGGVTRFFALTGGSGDVWAGNLGPDYWGAIRAVYTMDNLKGSWTKNMSGIDTKKHFAVYLSMAINDPNTCYIAGATTEPYTKPLVMKTSDGGATWKEVFLTQNNENIYTGYQGYQGDLDYWWGEFAEGFTVNAMHSNQAIITDLGFIHETTDGGGTWHQKYLAPEDENPAGQPTPKKKTYRGVGLQPTSVWQVYWFDSMRLFGCFTDIKGIRSTDGGRSWSMDYSGHDLNTLYHIEKHQTKPIWYAATSSIHDMYETTYTTDARLGRNGREGKVLFSTDKGKTWIEMRDFGTPVKWVTTSPKDPDVLYASVVSPDAKGGIWRARGISDPMNAIWEKLSNPPGANIGRPNNIRVLNDGTLVVSWGVRKDNDKSVFYPGSGVFVSTNDGATWVNRSHPDMRFWTQDVVIDPLDPDQNTWYACVWSGWGGPANDLGGVFKTTDRGMTWTRFSLPGQFHRVYSVTVAPKQEGRIYLTTETEGLWARNYSDTTQGEWYPVQSYPYHAPRRVIFNPYQQNQMWVTSFGNGLMYGDVLSETTFTALKSSIKIFPNPVPPNTDVLHIVTPQDVIRYEMVDLQGKIVRTARHSSLLSVQGLPPGIYLLRIKTLFDESVHKIVVQ